MWHRTCTRCNYSIVPTYARAASSILKELLAASRLAPKEVGPEKCLRTVFGNRRRPSGEGGQG